MATVDERDTKDAAPDALPAPRRGNLVVPAIVVVLVAAAVLRVWTRSDLWLDERLTHNIARLPLGDIPDALRRDGSPPLYYLLLHGWMAVFGESDFAARLLSGTLGLATLPLAWFVGRRAGRGDLTVAWASVLLLASSPFAVRYSTEVRMYALVMVIVLAGYLAITNALERPSFIRLAAVAMLSGLLVLTHYWAFYLLAVVVIVLVWMSRAGGMPALFATPSKVALAVAAGAILVLPWLPVLVFQLKHTGAPWGEPAGVGTLVSSAFEFSGEWSDAGFLLGALLLGLCALAVRDGAERFPSRRLAGAVWGTLAVAILVGIATRAAYAPRYAAVVFPLFIVLAAVGVATLRDRRTQVAVVAAAVVLGGFNAVPNVTRNRTQAETAANAINRLGSHGDVVAYCPDQLGPSVSHYVTGEFDQLTFPTAGDPEFVDWVDYRARNQRAEVDGFARLLLERADGRGLFLVWAPNYKTLGTKCQALVSALSKMRGAPDRPVKRKTRFFERTSVVHFPAP